MTPRNRAMNQTLEYRNNKHSQSVTMFIMKLVSFAMAVAFSVSAPVFAANALGVPNWDATLATQTARLPGSQAQLQDLFGLVRIRDHAALERRLDAVITGGALSQPARDAILFDFTVGLADFDDVDPVIIDRLRGVRSLVLVSHEERAGVGVPLFNIAAAAEGVFGHHQRLAAREDAALVMEASAEAWVGAYLLANGDQRRGFNDSLETATSDVLSRILENSLQQLPKSPELTPAAGMSALLLSDAFALQQVVRYGGGADLARILEAAGNTLANQDALALLRYAVSEAPAVNASLAIAQLYPALASSREAGELLLSHLDHSDLGPAAALALANAGGPDVRARLRQIAQQDEGLASSRARIALGAGSAQGVLE